MDTLDNLVCCNYVVTVYGLIATVAKLAVLDRLLHFARWTQDATLYKNGRPPGRQENCQ